MTAGVEFVSVAGKVVLDERTVGAWKSVAIQWRIWAEEAFWGVGASGSIIIMIHLVLFAAVGVLFRPTVGAEAGTGRELVSSWG